MRVIELHDAEALDPRVVGSKAANLARLHRAGIRIPAFFVVVFEEEDAVALGSSGETGGVGSLLDRAARLSEDWSTELAVRSSADVEDLPGATMAGQLRSRLGVRSPRDLLEAIRFCLAAADATEVASYLAARGAEERVRIALIVQRQVTGPWAGVAITGMGAHQRRCVLSEAAATDTAAVTSGRQCDLRVLYCDRPAAEPGCVSLVADQPAELAPAERDLWMRLGLLVNRVSAILPMQNSDVDVEWVWDGEQFWVLQVRPAEVAPLPSWVRESATNIWTSFFFTERFFNPVSPLGYDLIGPLVEQRAFRDPLRYLGHEQLANSPLTRLVTGRPVTRWEVFRKLHEIIPPRFLPPEKRLAFFPDGVPRMPIGRRFLTLLRAAVRVTRDPDWLPWANLRRWRFFVRSYQRNVEDLSRQIDRATTVSGLLACMERGRGLTSHLLAIHRWSLTFAELFERGLTWFLEHALGISPDLAMQRCAALLAGLEANLTLQMHTALAEMRESPSRFKDLQREFLRRFGHRSSSLDVAEPTWREQPEILDRLPTPHAAIDVGLRRRLSAEREIRERVQLLPWSRRVLLSSLLHQLLKYGRDFAVLRENQRHYWHLVLAELRKAALRIGEELVREGFLARVDDVFFLRLREIEELARSSAMVEPEALRRTVAQRRRLHEQWRRVRLPSLLAEGETATWERGQGQKRVLTLRGIGVSPGKATGPAYFPEAFTPESIPPGSVLIMPGLDPGWTPVLPRIVGLITEAGGALSHGAILAREFGVPAVASVSGASALIRPGQLVSLDGTSGFVEILPEPA